MPIQEPPESGSWEMIRAALRHPRLSWAERAILAELATHDLEQYSPSMGKLAAWYHGEDNRRNRDYMRRKIGRLESAGVLEIQTTTTGSGARSFNRYRLLISAPGSPLATKKVSRDTRKTGTKGNRDTRKTGTKGNTLKGKTLKGKSVKKKVPKKNIRKNIPSAKRKSKKNG